MPAACGPGRASAAALESPDRWRGSRLRHAGCRSSSSSCIMRHMMVAHSAEHANEWGRWEPVQSSYMPAIIAICKLYAAAERHVDNAIVDDFAS